jgi:hypothetical protein
MVPSGLQHRGKDATLCGTCGRDEDMRHVTRPFPVLLALLASSIALTRLIPEAPRACNMPRMHVG